MYGVILLVVLVLLFLATFPKWSHSKNWGYGPSSGIGLLLVIVLILFYTKRL